MNGLERFRAVLRGEPLDHLPCMPILMAFKARFMGSDYRAFATDHRVKVEGNLLCAERFGSDVVDVMSDPYCETQGFGAEIEYPEDDVPRCPRPPLADTKDLSRLVMPDPLGSPRMLNQIRAVRGLRERSGGRYSIHGWVEGPAAEASNLRGVATFLMDLLLDPSWCSDLMDLCTEVAIRYARAQIESGAHVIGVGDALCSQIPPDVHAELVAPRQQRLLRAIREAGGHTRLHICGDITHLLPVLRDLEVEILDVDHPVDMGAVRDVLGRGMVLAGNLDPVGDVLQGTSESIREGFKGIYRRIGNPMIVTAGCEIPRDTPHQNLDALCEPIPYRGDA